MRDRRWLVGLFDRNGWRLRPRWPRRTIHTSFGREYRAWMGECGDGCLLFFRVGRFIEFRGPQRLRAERVLGLRRVALPRGGYLFAAGFPVSLLRRYVARALAAGSSVILPLRTFAGPHRGAIVAWASREDVGAEAEWRRVFP
ncbi:hypothetical protein L6Q96_10700 [Candidatus Binatia bacterium]|nr:hypothetical protein [Candidatus Binatia bacterium]